jgi:hypothetical protein
MTDDGSDITAATLSAAVIYSIDNSTSSPTSVVNDVGGDIQTLTLTTDSVTNTGDASVATYTPMLNSSALALYSSVAAAQPTISMYPGNATNTTNSYAQQYTPGPNTGAMMALPMTTILGTFALGAWLLL